MPSPTARAPATQSSWDAITDDLRTAAQDRLVAAMDAAATELRTVDGELAVVGEELQAWAASSGKRLRPILVCLGHELAGGDPGDVVGPATAVELVHTWALVHDDLIDASDTRRGRPTTHRRFATLHRSRGWVGDADEWGGAIAILVGDLVAVLADDAFTSAAVDGPHMVAGRDAFSRLRREVVAGQVLDVTVAASGWADVDRALRVAMLKSGRYSVTRPLEVGANLAGADQRLLATLATAGDSLGLAFQLRDDLLGAFGNPDVTGKPVGDDLREGKRTVLVAEAMARLTAASGAQLEGMLGRRDLDEAQVEQAIGMLRDSGAEDATTTRIADLLQVARREVARLPDGRGREALLALADHVATRRH